MKINFDRLQPVEVKEELPEGLFWAKDGSLNTYCCCCDQPTEWYGEIEEYDGSAWCGRSPRCCP